MTNQLELEFLEEDVVGSARSEKPYEKWRVFPSPTIGLIVAGNFLENPTISTLNRDNGFYPGDNSLCMAVFLPFRHVRDVIGCVFTD